jgi:mannitol/fructose-specific phosphotransferase system IIA component (Ntr-type)
MRISDYLTRDRIALDLDAGPKTAVLGRLVSMLAASLGLPDHEPLLAEVLRRESIMSTGIGDGIAIPHAAADGIAGPAIAIGIAPAGIDFESVDGKPVHVIFLLVGSRDAPGLQLKALARIARLTREPGFIASLTAARTPEAALALIAAEDARGEEVTPPPELKR